MEDFNEPIPEHYENLNTTEFAAVNPKIKVKIIKFSGINRTDSEFLMKIIEKSSISQSENLTELSDSLTDSFKKLERLNIFKDISVIIDQAEEDEKDFDSDESVHKVKIVFNCKEKKFNVRTGTELQRKDIAWNFGGQFFNLFGRAESLEINSSIGANSSMPFKLNFVKPICVDKNFFINCARFKENFLNHCKWRQDVQSFSTGLQFEYAGNHEVKYLNDHRRLFDVQSGASHVIRDQSGKSIKSSLIHSWTSSTRDSSVFPTKGHLIRISQELAGFGGDAKFFKSELTLQNNFTSGIFTLTKTFKIGKIFPFNNCPIFDRFQMGGPTSLRGFPVNSLGPRQFSDSLGGTSLIETGLQLSFPVIKSASNFARAHLFINAGLLSDEKNPLLQRIKKFQLDSLNPNVSVGAGFMFKMAESARLELNFSVPILTQSGVVPNRGVQVGIGMEFL